MREIAVRPVLWTALAIALVVAATVAVVLAMLHWNDLRPGGERLQYGYEARLDAPGLSSAPQDELRQDRRRKQARLDSAGWVDQGQGIAHIPIADAMDLLVVQRAKEAKP
jgi:hypothetical protein